jgi:hypothetical protein
MCLRAPILRASILAVVPLALALVTLTAGRASAATSTIGTMSAWQTVPSQALDDKVFTWLASSASWNGSELVLLSSNAIGDIHSLNLDSLTTYTGPLTLTVDYRIDITSADVFAAIGLDTDTLAPNTVAYKDVFSSLALLEAAGGFGTGDLAALTSVNGFPAFTALPAIQQIWVRDTIQLDAPGQLNSVSNSVLQTVPEPGTLALAGLALAACAVGRLRRPTAWDIPGLTRRPEPLSLPARAAPPRTADR